MEENFYEFLSLGLAVAVGVAGILAFVYKRGQVAGVDKACGDRIEGKIGDLETKIDNMKVEGDEIHNELKESIHIVGSKVDKLIGAFETFRQFLNKT